MKKVSPDRKRLNRMIRLYARQRGFDFKRAWLEFTKRYCVVYRTDIDNALERYSRIRKRRVTLPAFFEETGNLDRALHVAGNLLEGR